MIALRKRLRQEEAMLATFSIVPSVEIVQIIALAGFDAVILDTEHGPYGIEALVALIAAAHARQMHAIVRVRENSAAWIGAALDAGADGILVPQVASRREAEAAVAAARFAPLGRRGANPWVTAAGYGGDPGWFAAANEAVAVIVMIEGAEGVAAAAAIVERRSSTASSSGRSISRMPSACPATSGTRRWSARSPTWSRSARHGASRPRSSRRPRRARGLGSTGAWDWWLSGSTPGTSWRG